MPHGACSFNDRFIKGLKPTGTTYYVSDTHPKTLGLQMRVGESGSKSWSLRYRVNGHQRRLTLGKYPKLSLANARANAKTALKKVSARVDPALATQERNEAPTVCAFIQTYLDEHAKKHKRSWKDDETRLRIDVKPYWKNTLMRDITRPHVRELLTSISKRGPIIANRVRALLHKFFAVAIELDVVEMNPVTGIRRPGVEHQRDRVLTPDELRRFWTTCDKQPIEMQALWKVRLLTAQRGGECRDMKWHDVDLVGAWWTIPSSGSKNKLSHRVPLSPTVVDLLTQVRAKTDERLSKQKDPKPALYVFQHARSKRLQTAAAATFGIADFHGHDLRRSAASLMASSGVPRLVISKILNHVESSVTAVYDRHSYDAEKATALQSWARTLLNILEQKDDNNVLPFAARS